MAYLNEDGLETLVGKIKGQVIELTSAEYRQLPATKNTDNKLYFVNDEAYAYQIDDEPTSGSSGLVKSGGVYNWTSKIGSGTLTTTAQTLIPAVNEVNAKIGSTDISTIGDGTLTGAIDALNNGSIKYVDVQTTCVSGTWQTLTLPSGISSDRVINVTKRTGFYGCLWWKKDDSTLTFLRISTTGTNMVLVDTAGDVTLRVFYY